MFGFNLNKGKPVDFDRASDVLLSPEAKNHLAFYSALSLGCGVASMAMALLISPPLAILSIAVAGGVFMGTVMGDNSPVMRDLAQVTWKNAAGQTVQCTRLCKEALQNAERDLSAAMQTSANPAAEVAGIRKKFSAVARHAVILRGGVTTGEEFILHPADSKPPKNPVDVDHAAAIHTPRGLTL